MQTSKLSIFALIVLVVFIIKEFNEVEANNIKQDESGVNLIIAEDPKISGNGNNGGGRKRRSLKHSNRKLPEGYEQ